MMRISQNCAHCGNQAKSRSREFTDQAWTVLVLWGEVEKSAVGEPICEDCYDEMRNILIERAHEVETALKTPAAAQQPQRHRRVG